MKALLRLFYMICCFFALTSCNIILGTPNDGAELPIPPPYESTGYDFYIDGSPVSLSPADTPQYYIWKVGNSWHVRISGMINEPLSFTRGPFFSGLISTSNAVITNVVSISEDPFDNILNRLNDIQFEFEFSNNIKGLDFELKPASRNYCVIMDLRVNGVMMPELVRLGHSMYVPQTLPLKICFD